MKLYCVSGMVPEIEGEDTSEYYSSKVEALKVAKAYAGCLDPYDPPIEVDLLTLAKLPTKQLVLACLNRRHFVAESEIVWTSGEA